MRNCLASWSKWRRGYVRSKSRNRTPTWEEAESSMLELSTRVNKACHVHWFHCSYIRWQLRLLQSSDQIFLGLGIISHGGILSKSVYIELTNSTLETRQCQYGLRSILLFFPFRYSPYKVHGWHRAASHLDPCHPWSHPAAEWIRVLPSPVSSQLTIAIAINRNGTNPVDKWSKQFSNVFERNLRPILLLSKSAHIAKRDKNQRGPGRLQSGPTPSCTCPRKHWG